MTDKDLDIERWRDSEKFKAGYAEGRRDGYRKGHLDGYDEAESSMSADESAYDDGYEDGIKSALEDTAGGSMSQLIEVYVLNGYLYIQRGGEFNVIDTRTGEHIETRFRVPNGARRINYAR